MTTEAGRRREPARSDRAVSSCPWTVVRDLNQKTRYLPHGAVGAEFRGSRCRRETSCHRCATRAAACLRTGSPPRREGLSHVGVACLMDGRRLEPKSCRNAPGICG